ncbi:MAG: hypothetical protein Rubg2KO_07660 [Rubricoccaceae bacterium]
MVLLPILSALLALSPAAPAPDSLETPARTLSITTGTVETLNVTGVAGGSSDTRMPGGNAILWGLHLDEASDKPCDLELFWWRQDTSSRTQGLFKTTFRLCGDKTSSDGFVGVGYSNSYIVWDSNGVPTGNPHVLAPSVFLAAHGVRACLNRRGDRIKGVRLLGSTVNQDDAGEARRDFGLMRDFERTNCNTWKTIRKCDVGDVVVGVDIHHSDGEIHGLAPKCAPVTVRDVMVASPND